MEPITREEMLMDGQTLEPITRKEKILAGEDLEPITREEWFLKKYRGGGGGDIDLQTLNVTENGTVNAPSGVAYDKVVTDVPLPSNAYLLKELSNLPQPIATFNDGSDLPLKSLTASIEPVQAGSGDPSPTNVRPISGWTEENIIVIDDDINKNYFYGLSKGLYGVVDLGSLSWTYSGGYFRTLNIPNFKAVAQYTTPNAISSIYTVKTWNSINNTDNMCFAIPSNAGGQVIFVNTDYTDPTTFKEAMQGVHLIYELANPTAPTITDTLLNALFEEFDANGHATTIPFTDSPGNPVEVYGGSVDVVNGSLDENQFCYKVTSDTSITKSGNYFEINNVLPEDATANYQFKASFCKRTETSLAYMVDGEGRFVTDRRYLAVKLPYSTVEDVKTYLTSINAQIVYTLPTSTTLQQQPTSIKSLDGVNNVFASTGDVEELKYFSKEV